VGAGVLALVVGLIFGGLFRPYVFSGSVIQSSESAPSMDPLTYENGDPVDLTDFRGEVLLVYFGYTHCPDLCPAMLSAVDQTVEALGDDGDRVNAMMVTVDPERDTPQFLGEYVTHFNPRFRGVWGSVEDVRAVATNYGVHFELDEPDEDGNYFVAHTAKLMAIDTNGVLRLLYPVGVTAEELTADMRELLR
jgi:protein SCO1/2